MEAILVPGKQMGLTPTRQVPDRDANVSSRTEARIGPCILHRDNVLDDSNISRVGASPACRWPTPAVGRNPITNRPPQGHRSRRIPRHYAVICDRPRGEIDIVTNNAGAPRSRQEFRESASPPDPFAAQKSAPHG